MKFSTHHHMGDPEYNNPLADRFDKYPPKRPDGFSRIAYVMQGGGSLGAYQAGVLMGLLEAGYSPDWISATSIGAILGAIVVGNTPENRVARLKEFWQRIGTSSPFDILGNIPATMDLYNKLSCDASLMLGQRGFFTPRWSSPHLQLVGDPSTISYYDTSPLRETLLDLIDFELLNSCKIRLSLGSVQVSTGQLIYFNNINYIIKPEHIMASAALPPGFPAIKIGNEFYWDGGIHSNTPLEVILDAKPATDTLCFVIDCFGGSPFIPTDMDGVTERTKDIGYSTHARRVIKNYIEKQNLQTKLLKIYDHLNKESKQIIAPLLEEDAPHQQTLVHVTYSARIHKGASKDYNFGQIMIKKRMEVGYKDALAMLAESSKWDCPTDDFQCRLYEAPNNLSQLMRIDD